MRNRLLALGLAVLAAVAIAPPATAAPAAKTALGTLPAPTGRSQVGTASLRLVDEAREDPWVPGRKRELMVSAWYPTRDAGRIPVAPQMQPAAAAHFDTFAGPENYGVPSGTADWASVRTSGHLDAAVARSGRLPVILFSPGAVDPRTFGTTDVEDLASRGYLVITIDHTYEASEVAFPGGRLETSRLREILAQTTDITALLTKIVAVRVADTRFVLDALGQLAHGHNPDADDRRLPSGLIGAPDLARVGMYGHSGGGFTALQTMHDDGRIKAAANLDGQLSYGLEDDGTALSTVASDGLNRPFLLIGSAPGGDHTKRPSWRALWNNSHGLRIDRTLPGSGHGSLTDAEALLPRLAAQGALPADVVTKHIGAADPATTIATQRAWLASFFDQTLRSR